MKVENAAGRKVETKINGKKYKPFGGAKKYSYESKVTSLRKAFKKCGLKDGDTLSFHHQLRNGDYVVNQTLDVVRELGVKNIRLAQTALFNIHKPVIDHIKDGVVTRIEGSINGIVGDFVSKNPLPHPVILRSHGGRWAAVKNGELHVDIAVIAASAADERGNATGLVGESAFGPICYSQIDAMCADHVIVVTDNLVDRPCPFHEINEGQVDYVVETESIGDPKNIVSGSLEITTDPMKQQIAQDCIKLMDAAGLIQDDMIFQSGAGGISLAAVKYLDEKLEEKGAVAAGETGGFTKFIIDMYEQGRLRYPYASQCFDTQSVDFVAKNPQHITDIGHYADPTSKGRMIDGLDAVVLGATEVDTQFNVNVNTHSDGRLLHGIGGHQDTAAAAFLTMITVPLYRKSIPIVRDAVTTLTTPGDVVDAIVTNEGIAINPRRTDLLKRVKGKINLMSIEELKERAYNETDGPPEIKFGEQIIGLTKWFDGTLLDTIKQVEE